MSQKLSEAQRRRWDEETETPYEEVLSKIPKLTGLLDVSSSPSTAEEQEQPTPGIPSTFPFPDNTRCSTPLGERLLTKLKGDKPKKLSGAQRRKLNKEREAALEATLPKIHIVVTTVEKGRECSSAPVTSDTDSTLPVEVIISEETSEQSEESTEIQFNNDEIELDDGGTELCAPVNSDSVILLTNDPFSWPQHLTQEQQDQLVLLGPMPFFKFDDQYPRNSQKRHFSNDYQYRRPGNGEKIRRRWLCYSPTADSSYCFCCRLYDPVSKSRFGQQSGNNNWKHIGDRLCSHETSQDHFKYMKAWVEAELRLKGDSSSNRELTAQGRKEAERWEETLKRITAIILYLAEHNIPFQGTSSKLFTKNNGNFLGLVQLLGQFDNRMMEHLRQIANQEHHVHTLDWSIQNELIFLLAKQVKQAIIEKIKCSKYFSVIMDCTPYISHKEQASLTLRYIHEDQDIDGNLTVEESFIAYTITEEFTGEALTNLLFSEIAACGLDMNDCRGQGYDHVASSAGTHKGVQARIMEEYPRTASVPCGCHCLNLVAADGAKASVRSTSLFGVLQRLHTIFAGSAKRWCIVSEYVNTLTLKQACERRWEACIDSVKAVRYQYFEIRNALIELEESVDDPKIASEAQSLIRHMEDFSFIVCLIVWHDLLFEVDQVSQTLQRETVDISLAMDQLEKCMNFVQSFRESGFDDAVITGKEISDDLEIEPIFPCKRRRTRKVQFSNESSDDYQGSPEEDFKRDVFYPLIENLNMSLNQRFSQLNRHHMQWGFLYNLNDLPEKDQLKKCCNKLQVHLTNEGVSDIDANELFHELLHGESILDEEMKNTIATPIEVLRRIKNTDRKDLFTNLWIALRILLTIPVTVANGDTSFSKLKLIKTHLRSSITEERLAPAILSIENEEARKLDFRELISSYANTKARI